jgi:outer membrane biogenesis lipoprotein LolB
MTWLRVVLLLAILLLAGCGEKDVGPKTELNEKEQEQLKELNQQRTDEWGNKAR